MLISTDYIVKSNLIYNIVAGVYESCYPMVGQRLRQAREKRGYSRNKVAALTGIGTATLQRYEDTENENVSFAILVDLAKFFNVSTDYLLGLSNDPTPDFDLTPDEQDLLNAYRRGDVAEIVQLAAKVSK